MRRHPLRSRRVRRRAHGGQQKTRLVHSHPGNLTKGIVLRPGLLENCPQQARIGKKLSNRIEPTCHWLAHGWLMESSYRLISARKNGTCKTFYQELAFGSYRVDHEFTRRGRPYVKNGPPWLCAWWGRSFTGTYAEQDLYLHHCFSCADMRLAT